VRQHACDRVLKVGRKQLLEMGEEYEVAPPVACRCGFTSSRVVGVLQGAASVAPHPGPSRASKQSDAASPAVIAVAIIGGVLAAGWMLYSHYTSPPPVAGHEITDRQNAKEARLNELITSHQVVVGMTTDQVERTWGAPLSRTTTTVSAGTMEDWSYRGKGVLFLNGHVASFSVVH
jgi:hypothetical protein